MSQIYKNNLKYALVDYGKFYYTIKSGNDINLNKEVRLNMLIGEHFFNSEYEYYDPIDLSDPLNQQVIVDVVECGK